MAPIDTDDAVSVLDHFQELEDPRSTVNRTHLLGDRIVICILAVIAGANGPKAIGVWAEANADWLRRYLRLPGGIPSHDTIGRLLAALQPELGVKRFAASVRGHWGLENTLHWCLDVTFREDESRVRNRLAADNLAWRKRFAISLLKQQTDKESIAMGRKLRMCNSTSQRR